MRLYMSKSEILENLQIAIANSNDRQAIEYIDSLDEDDLCNAVNVVGNNLLHQAVSQHGNLEIIGTLLSKAPNLLIGINNAKENVLHVLIRNYKPNDGVSNNCPEVIKYIFENHTNNLGTLINHHDVYGTTPLGMLFLLNFPKATLIQISKLFIKQDCLKINAYLNNKEGMDYSSSGSYLKPIGGFTILHMALKLKIPKILELLHVRNETLLTNEPANFRYPALNPEYHMYSPERVLNEINYDKTNLMLEIKKCKRLLAQYQLEQVLDENSNDSGDSSEDNFESNAYSYKQALLPDLKLAHEYRQNLLERQKAIKEAENIQSTIGTIVGECTKYQKTLNTKRCQEAEGGIAIQEIETIKALSLQEIKQIQQQENAFHQKLQQQKEIIDSQQELVEKYFNLSKSPKFAKVILVDKLTIKNQLDKTNTVMLKARGDLQGIFQNLQYGIISCAKNEIKKFIHKDTKITNDIKLQAGKVIVAAKLKLSDIKTKLQILEITIESIIVKSNKICESIIALEISSYDEMLNKTMEACPTKHEVIPVEVKEHHASIVIPHFHGVPFMQGQYTNSERREIAKKLFGINKKLLNGDTASLNELEAVIGIHSRTSMATVGLDSLHHLIKADQNQLEQLEDTDAKLKNDLAKCWSSSNKEVDITTKQGSKTLHFLNALKKYIYSFSESPIQEVWDNLKIQQQEGEQPQDQQEFSNIVKYRFPFVSSSKAPDHAIKFAIGKNVETQTRGEKPLYPNYDVEGYPVHRLAGFLFITFHKVNVLDQLESSKQMVDMTKLLKSKKITGDERIDNQVETTFFGGINKENIAAIIPIIYPNFSKGFKQGYHDVVWDLLEENHSGSPANFFNTARKTFSNQIFPSCYQEETGNVTSAGKVMMPAFVKLALDLCHALAEKKGQKLYYYSPDGKLCKYSTSDEYQRKGNTHFSKTQLDIKNNLVGEDGVNFNTVGQFISKTELLGAESSEQDTHA